MSRQHLSPVMRERALLLLFAAAALALAAACAFPIGYSVEGRPLAVQRFGDGPKYVLLVGGLHTGSEDNSRIIVEQLATYLGEQPDVIPGSVTVLVLSSANPDGSANGEHTNARGVDLNRNWPSDDWVTDACHPETGCRPGLGGPQPLSEPETAALYAMIEEIQPAVTIVWHAEAPLVEANEAPGAERYGRAFAEGSGYEYVEEWTAYEITGELIDALEQRLGLPALDVELGDCCVVSQEEFGRNLNGLVQTLRAVHRGLDTTPEPAATPAPRRTVGIPPDLP
jgi:predicted deacylase